MTIKDREPTEAIGLVAMSADVDDPRTLKVHFHEPVTQQHRQAIVDGLNRAMVTASPPVDHGRVAELEAEVRRLQVLANNARAKSKRAARDLLREEADAARPHFTPEFEPLRAIAERAGSRSAAWLASRARNLQERGLVESKWIGNDRTSSFKVWRLKGRPVPVHASGPTPLTNKDTA